MSALDLETVRRVQRRVGVLDDGDFGPVTLAAVDAALQQAAPAATKSAGIPAQSRGDRIIAEAKKYLGLTEVVGNRKWDLLTTPGKDPVADELVRVLTAAGWQPGWPYCSSFAEAVWRAAYADNPQLAAEIAAVLGPHCMTTWRAASAKGWTSVTPVRGAIGIMRKGTTDDGHAFLVDDPAARPLRTIEANTSANAGTVEADRNGDGIYAKKRALDFTKTSGLYLLGFIVPPVG